MFKTLRAILAQNRRLEDLERRLESLSADSRRRDLALEETRAALEYVQADITKLRGRVTGGLRKKGDENGEQQPPPQEDVNQLIREGRFPIRRR